MSLTRMLLNGVTESAVEDTKEFPEVEDMAAEMDAMVEEEPTAESWCDAAMESMAMELFTIDKAYHVADIIGEAKVLTEGANPEVLLEGMVKSGIAKIKEAFKKFWAKLKSWFAAVKRQFNLIFKTGKDFIKEFKSELDKKDVKGYIYKGYKYQIDKGDGEGLKINSLVRAKVNEITVDALDAENKYNKDDAAANAKWMAEIGFGSDKSQSEMEEEFVGKEIKCNGAKNIEELRKELTDIYRGGDEMEEIEDFEVNGKDEMIAFVNNFDKSIKRIEKYESDFDSTMKTIIGALDKLEKSKVGDVAYKAAQAMSKQLNMLLAVGKVPSSVAQAIYKEANGQFERALKGYLRFKPAKEAAEAECDGEDCDEEEPATESLLDQAMKLFV